MSKLLALALILSLLGTALALYDNNSKVIKLNKSRFQNEVINSKELWLVEFFAPWCGHCKSLAPEWEKAAKALEGIVKVGAVDMTTDQEVGSPYNIQGFPTIKFFGDNKSKPQDYNSGRTANDLINYALNEAKSIAQRRLSGGSSSSGNRQSGGSKGNANADNDGDVVVLTDDNFDANVVGSKEPWFIEFYAPWCGHCKNLQPEWNKLATEMKTEGVKVAKVDATVHPKVAQRFGVNGYPTIKFFPAGFSSDSEAVDYNGGRDASSLGSWAKEQRDAKKPIMFTQLLNQSIYDEYCTNNSGVCIIFLLPHIYDSSAAQRNGYINLITEIAQANKGRPITYLWSQGGDQYDFEEKLNAGGSGYPSAMAISHKKNLYQIFKGSFKKKDLDSFISGLLTGRGSFSTLPTLPKIKKVKEWDGQDAEQQQTDNSDL
ncbi:protein disulfide isomerase family A protein (macronuclear) [Tetrahymena thermophila SB210]|uniref:protein disulfide-isomerase n=1 Tax=Tetrahymena thermophila (strain SB210) TaxID=312017 RepID=Q22XT0_TETTS|nr:protein disulfide isomerase family A protein [Tetrahymena thermophila SB210]EAR90091.1 protein disulfide isomerase family A protein [Tetrahymena thermophila SB210]|eukprot:XP_001010336.1 protein disulfide isomerase family A protein [Tetrahymena thermophila SB210]